MSFERGQVVVRRCMHRDGRIAAVQTARVVADDGSGLVLWVERGSATVQRVDVDGRPTRALPLRVEIGMTTLLAPSVWEPYRTLMVLPPAARHSVWLSWTVDGDFVGWYVNLEEVLRRWGGGVDVIDHTLDLLVPAAGDPAWKDEEELAEQTADPPLWTPDEVAAVRAEGERVAELGRARSFPFAGTRRGFRPDPGWVPTGLPPWWDVP